MRILWVSDAGCHSGFATVTHNIGERLQRDFGHDVHVLASNYRGDAWATSLSLYPANLDVEKDIVGMSRIIKLCAQLMPEVVVFVNDPPIVRNFLLSNPWDQERVLWRGLKGETTLYKPPIIAYLPIDGYNSPRSWDVLGERVTRVAMSEFGQRQMPEASVVWHGVDHTIFKPMNRTQAKRALGFDPDRFLILRVDKNSFRKSYDSTWQALKPLLRRYSDIDVFFHCQPQSRDGFNLNEIFWNDEDIRDRVNFPANLGGFIGWPDEQLATLHAAADVFVSTSHGEGWGLTLGQSLACGTPVVATDCSAITEVVGPGGILIPPGPRTYAPMGQEQCLPDVQGFTDAIGHLYESKGLRRDLAEAGIEHIKRADWDVAAQEFDRILRQAVAGEVPNAVPVGVGPSASDQEEVRVAL